MNSLPDNYVLNSSVILVSLPGAMRRSLRAILESATGVQFLGSASGGLTASTLVQHHQPDLIIIDANLPIDEAFALIQDVKQKRPAIRCVTLTTTERLSRKALLAGSDAAITRSSTPAELFNAMRQAQYTADNKISFLETTDGIST